MAFYCALHCVEAYLATFGEHSHDHTDREALMVQLRFGIPRSLFNDYRHLKSRSMQARYHMRRFTPEAVRQSIFPYLARVTLFVQLDSS